MKQKPEIRTAKEIVTKIHELQEKYDAFPPGHSMKDGILMQIQILHWVQGDDNPPLRPCGRMF